jgi:superfamily II DNA or RNA helicase
MDIDFDKLGVGDSANTELHPRDIFSVLPTKHSRYQYPRDVQTEVWNGWHARRNDPEIVLKMNTGGGKTVVGLLVLKSLLNEKKGPAVYVCPDPLLVACRGCLQSSQPSRIALPERQEVD